MGMIRNYCKRFLAKDAKPFREIGKVIPDLTIWIVSAEQGCRGYLKNR